ncbi:hypothetical protein PV767_04160 [Stenotrophomonas rhizophila]|uniref:hypothetical protein n=1 Tax=Stenotrophomonas TaxID=40323 RepID=UPI003B7C5BB4
MKFGGSYYIGGDAPVEDGNPSDGRAKILNVPARVRIAVLERSSLVLVGATVSLPDGTWRIDFVSPDFDYIVLGLDDRGRVNGAVQDWVKPAPMVF